MNEALTITSSAKRPRRWPIVALLLLCGVLEFGIAPVFEFFVDNSFDTIFIALFTCLGILAAQGAVLSGWLVWSWRPFWQRLLIYWLLIAHFWACWLIGALGTLLVQGDSLRDFLEGESLWQGSAIVPVCSLALQAPLWCLRWLLGYRLVERGNAKSLEVRPLSIADLLAATAVLAISLAPVRTPNPRMPPEELAVVLAFTALASLLLLPLPALLISRGPTTLLGTVAATLALVILALVFCTGFAAIGAEWNNMATVLGPMFMAAGALALLFCALARAAGLRVVTRW